MVFPAAEQRRASLSDPRILEDDVWTLKGNPEGSQTLREAIQNVSSKPTVGVVEALVDDESQLCSKSEPLLEGWLSLGFSTY